LPDDSEGQKADASSKRRGEAMFRTIVIILGVAAVAGFAVWLMVPWEARVETAGVLDVEADARQDPTPPEVMAVEGVDDEAEETVSETHEEQSSAVEPPAVVFAADGSILAGEYDDRTQVAGVNIYWSNSAETLRVGLVSPGTGYLAIGFDPENRMEGANFIVGYFDDGKVYIRDDYGTGTTSHAADSERGGEDNILSSGGAEWADQTIIEFVIPLDSGDAMDKPLLPGSTYTILVAYHDLLDGFAVRHSRRGVGSIELSALADDS